MEEKKKKRGPNPKPSQPSSPAKKGLPKLEGLVSLPVEDLQRKLMDLDEAFRNEENQERKYKYFVKLVGALIELYDNLPNEKFDKVEDVLGKINSRLRLHSEFFSRLEEENKELWKRFVKVSSSLFYQTVTRELTELGVYL